MRGDASGDLVVSVEVSESSRFERRGDDLYCTVQVDALQAIVGTTVTIDGIMEGERVTVEVPAGCQFGQQVVVERRGMPRMGMIARGNLVAVVQVETPRDLTKKQILDIASIVAERSLETGDADGAPDDVSPEEREGFSAAAENVAEHFAKGWRAPKNPFGKGRR